MATAEITNRALYNTYKNGAVVDSTATDYRYIGYSNSSGEYKYSTCYKFVLPTIDGVINSITLTPYLNNPNTGNLVIPKSWKIGISPNTTNSYYASGNYNTTGTYTKTFSLKSNLAGGADVTLDPVTFNSVSGSNFTSGQTLYIYVYADLNNVISKAKITSLLGYVTYTPTTYYATKGTCTYATASVTPTSGTFGTSFTLTASSYANDDNYIYGGLTYTYGNNAGGGVNSPYASGYGAKQTITNTGTYSSDFTYTASASRYTADPAPNDVACTVSNVTSSNARVTVPSSGITTTFLGDYYYITVTDCNNIAGSLTGSTRFSRSTGYVNLTGLTSGTTHKMYVYAYNSYNERYYKISTVEFATDQSSYSATITANVTGSTSATASMSNLSSTTNLDSYWYLVKSDAGSTSTSISNYFRQNRGSTITLSNTTTPALSPGSSITLYAYVKSSVSGTYYKVGSVAIKTHSYIYYTDSNGNLIPCWTYMLIDGNWTQVILDVPGYKT